MLDIRLIREKPDFVRERLATRGGDDAPKVDELLKVDAERRKAETELQQLQSERNRLSKSIGAKKSRKEATKDLEKQVHQIGDQIVRLAQQFGESPVKSLKDNDLASATFRETMWRNWLCG